MNGRAAADDVYVVDVQRNKITFLILLVVCRPGRLYLLWHKRPENDSEYCGGITPRTAHRTFTHSQYIRFDYFHPPYLFFFCALSFDPRKFPRRFSFFVRMTLLSISCYCSTVNDDGSTENERCSQCTHLYRCRRCSILPSFPFSILMFSGCNIMFLYFSSGI